MRFHWTKKLAAFLLCSFFTASTAQAASLPKMPPQTQYSNISRKIVHSSWGVEKMGFDLFARSIPVPAKVTVAVIDTGVDTDHFLLKDRLTKGYDFGENKIMPEDKIGHGTYMAGIIADCTKAVQNIKIMPLKVAGADGTLTTKAECRAINYAVEHGAKVISISFAADLSSDHQIDEAIDKAVEKGVTVVVSAGNDSKDASLKCPAHNEKAITVSAINKDGTFAEYSNYGNCIDFAAPGSYICGADLNDNTRIDSGTSAAVPHVAAAAAMIYAKYPSASPSQVEELLKNSCIHKGSAIYYGHGLIHLAKLIH